jgi:hypothetical protein
MAAFASRLGSTAPQGSGSGCLNVSRPVLDIFKTLSEGKKKALLFEKRSKNFYHGPSRATHLASPMRGTNRKSFLVLFFKKERLPTKQN